MELPKGVQLKTQSWLAKLAAAKLGTPRVALVLGHTIHLHGVSAQEFLASPRWVRHELAHIKQYRRYGVAGFLVRYGLYSLRHGYYHNPLEAEARAAEGE